MQNPTPNVDPTAQEPISPSRADRKRVHDLLTLFDISKHLNTLDLDRLVNFFLKTIQGHYGVRQVSIVLLSEGTVYLSRAEGCEPEKGDAEGLCTPEMLSFLRRAGGPVVVRSEDGESELDLGDGINFGSPEVITPILCRSEVAGIILIGPKITRESYTDSDLEFLASLASQACVAIKNARYYEELKHKDEELQKAYRELKTLDRAKDDFIKIASHELNTPLTVVRLTASILLNGSAGHLTDFQRKLISQIDNSSERLQEINEDLIHLARSNYDVLQIHRETLLPKKLFRELDSKTAPLLAKRPDITLQITFQPRLPEIFVDCKRYVKVLEYLIQNAIKYTPESVGGTIHVTVQRDTTEDQLLVCVGDAGIGIASEYLERVFEPFFELVPSDQHSTNKTNFLGAGLGLGLAIVKDIVEADFGQIWIESDGVGHGSEVYFTIATKNHYLEMLPDRLDATIDDASVD